MTAAHAFHPPALAAEPRMWPVLAWQARPGDVIRHDGRACEVTQVTFWHHLPVGGGYTSDLPGFVLYLDDLASRGPGGTGRCETLTVPAGEVLHLIGGDPA